MIYKSSIGDIDLSRVVRLYPAAIVELDGESSEMSLEWVELYGSRVKILSYVLVFDFTQSGDELRNKKELVFNTKEELFVAIDEVAQFF